MGTVVRQGSGLGVVVRTGGRTEFGAIALKLGERQPQTAFQLGLRDIALLLVQVTALLAGSILVINVVLSRPDEGITFAAALDADGRPSDAVLRGGLLCNEATVSDGRVSGGNQLDQALWGAPASPVCGA